MTARTVTAPYPRAASVPSRSLRKDTAGVFASQVVVVATALAGAIITARVLGPSGRGVLTLATLWVSFFALAVPMSAGYGMIYQVRHSRATLSQALSSALGLSVVCGAVAFALALGLAPAFSRTFLAGVPLKYVLLAAVGLPAAIFAALASLALIGAGRARHAALLGAVNAMLSLAALAVAVLVLKWGVWGAIAAGSLSCLFGAALTVIWLRSELRPALLVQPELWRFSLCFGAKLHGGMLAQWANYGLDRFLINLYLGPMAVGVYTVAAMAAERLWLLPGAVCASLYSRTGGDAENDAEVTARACRVTFWLMAGACALVAAAAPPLIPRVLGAEFAPASRLLLVFLPGVLLLTLLKVLAPYICNRGKPAAVTYLSTGALVITLVLNLALIPRCGIAGAAIASSVAYGANGIASAVVFSKMSGLPLRALVSFPREGLRLLGRRDASRPERAP